MDGLLRAKFAYEGVNFRCVITPSDNIPSSLYPMVSNLIGTFTFSLILLFKSPINIPFILFKYTFV